MVTADGKKIEIPMLDIIHVEIEERIKLFAGKVFDVFATPREEKRAEKMAQ